MHFKQFYLNCLAHASYLIGSDGAAAIVDPQRDVEQYVAEAAAHNLKIQYVIETHLHADFVSGHQELARRTGAEIVINERAAAMFPHRAVRDGDELRVGRVVLRFLHTPGHTPEDTSILVIDTEESDEPQLILTGDTLFVGDVGRPDLAGVRGHTAADMAAMMYDTLHGKVLDLDDDLRVYPAHGAGSLCGRNISKETSSTIGEQRRTNYALQPMTKSEFVRMMTDDLPPAPAYFARSAAKNRRGACALAELPAPAALTPEEVEKVVDEGGVVLDVRTPAEFGAGHVPGALNVGLGGQFATWAGSVIAEGAPVVIVAEGSGQVDEAVMRLARVGLENVKGYLRGGMEAWRASGREVAVVEQISVAELRERLGSWQVLDVRQPGEYANGHVPGAHHIPLGQLDAAPLDAIDRARPLAVICAGGYRSSLATSILARRGIHHLFNVSGGTNAYVAAGYDTE